MDKVIDIDQSPIGRTPRSNPATYTGVFGDIRELFASTTDAKAKGFTAMLTPVLGVKLSHQVGQLQVLLAEICKAGINIDYMYALATGSDDASIVIKTADLEEAANVLSKTGVEFIKADEIGK